MIKSDDEYILDFKPEEKITQMAVFDVEDIQSDCSTISASEVSFRCNSPTPRLFCKLRKVRVMVKRLPQHVLAKYNLRRNATPFRSLLPVRSSSRRVKVKKVPGHYFSMNTNKPLTSAVNNKQKLGPQITNIERQQTIEKLGRISKKKLKLKNFKRPIKTAKPKKSYKDKQKPSVVKNSSVSNCFLPIQQKVQHKVTARIENNVNKHIIPAALPNSPNVTNVRSLQGRVAAKKQKSNENNLNNSVVSNLSNCPDVVITKYDIPKHMSKNVQKKSKRSTSTSMSPYVANEPEHDSAYNSSVDPSICPSMGQKCIRNFITVSRPQHGINVQAPLPIGTTKHTNYSRMQNSQSISAFPTSITSASQGIAQPIVPKIINLQDFRVPQHLSSKNDAVIVTPPKVLIINQPSKGNDPLDMASSLAKCSNTSQRQQVDIENNSESDIESETDIELSDAEKRIEPQIIKRIIYNTKSVQTKFTCNSSICGLVDTNGFNLNCFYCYDIFPLDKWFEFKEHIKLVHQVEEKENQSDSDEDVNISNSQSHQGLKTSQYPKTINNKNITLNKENFVTNAAITKETSSPKLPLEPRIVAQRLNKTYGSSDEVPASKKINQAHPSKHLTQPKNSTKRQSLNINLKTRCIDDVVILDSDTELETENMRKPIKPTTNYLQKVKQPSKASSNCSNSRMDEISKLIPPTLPHITIKKVDKVSPRENKNFTQPASRSSGSKETNIKLTSSVNVEKVINNLPQPKTQQLSTNGRIKPRYFVVKKVIKLPTTETIPNLHLSKGMILTKMSKQDKDTDQNSDDDDDDMLSNDGSEDYIPRPTNGRGILFGVTNSMVVIEFLLKLKTFPELWRSQLKNNTSFNYNEGIKKLCIHLNSRFELNITDIEMRLSIQRVKKWYCRILKKIHEHNTNSDNFEPYKHKFPLYFKILNQYLTSNINYNSMNKYPKWVQYKTKTPSAVSNIIRLDDKVTKIAEMKPKLSIAAHFKVPQPMKKSSIKPFVKPSTTTNTPPSKPAETVIEFDADTLYDHESSGEEVLETFDETVQNSSDKTDQIITFNKRRYDKSYYGHFECDVCRKTYKRIYDMKRHKILHLPPQFECGICSQKFYFKRWAERCSHLKKKRRNPLKKSEQQTPQSKRVWPKKIFRFKMICEICGASYRSIGSLNTHKRDKHLNQREKCIVCNFTALSNWRIVQHQKKRHIVEPGTVEELAKKSRARTDTKTPFSNEARQEFFWRREMRKKLKPGEIFYGCCKCRIVFNSRKEKVLHNKLEHPIKETTVLCLLCLPTKLLLSNSNCARRHYTDIHKVPWHEIDDLVKRTKPIFNLLSKEEIELVNASENYKELIEQLLKDKNLEMPQKVEFIENETIKAVQNLPYLKDVKQNYEEKKEAKECTQEENVYVDCIVDHDFNTEEDFNQQEYTNNNEHNYSEEQVTNSNNNEVEVCDDETKNDLYIHRTYNDQIIDIDYGIESSDSKMYNRDQNDHEYLQGMVGDFIEGELIEENIIVEECIEESIDEEVGEYF